MQIASEQAKGVFFAGSAFVVWGFFPLFFNLFDKDVGACEILAHRVIWSVFFMSLILILMGRIQNIKLLLTAPKMRNTLFFSGILICINWGVYLYAVNNGKILESSLGYFINPLMNMLLGAIVFKEKLSNIERLAVLIVLCSIGVQIYDLGELPLIAIILPASFALYGVVRKQAKIAALDGLFIETLLVLPFALFYIFYLSTNSQNHFDFDKNALLMIISGILTIIPLLAFNAATTRINLSIIGYLQYLSPTIAMLIGVFVFKENLGIWRAVSFSLIWLALGLVIGSKINLKKEKHG